MKSPRIKDINVKKYYILTQPSRLSDLSIDEFDDADDDAWRDKARRLQARRWRKIKHQLA